MMILVFWFTFMLLVLSMMMWLAKHPLSVGGCVLLLYMVGSVVVGLVCSFVMGVFLFLTGVSGMMVAFLYVVALCPNPVFKVEANVGSYGTLLLEGFVVSLFIPFLIMGFSAWWSFGFEVSGVGGNFQWLGDPSMYGGLAILMPFLGGLLFLCMVSVVFLCGQQKQCLGGGDYLGGSVFNYGTTKRAYG